ncbi:MAG: alpha/beta fold hydrolase [SAR324 cluster bacterium]|nr:alpha/beta fold hydrolase [SAR324 cluster bacterium]
MPIVVSQKQRIYYEVEGDKGPFLILHAPAFLTLDCWYKSYYVDLLGDHFRLVLIDPLGQGNSDSPEEPEFYKIESRIEHVLAIKAELGIDSFHFLGFGIGAQVGFMMAAYHTQHLRSLSTFGMHPYANTGENSSLTATIKLIREGLIKNYLNNHQEWNLSEDIQQKIICGSSQAYINALETSAQWQGVESHLPAMTTHAMLFTSTSEPIFLSVREAGRSMPHGRYLILPKIDYMNGLLNADSVVPPLLEFTKRQRGH